MLKNAEEGEKMKLSVKGLTLAGAIAWALGMLVVGILNLIWPGYGGEFLRVMASFKRSTFPRISTIL